MAEGIPRGEGWARGRFVLARTHLRGKLNAVIVTCKLHSKPNERCNKSLTVGPFFSEEEATQRIKEWCIRGLDIGRFDGDRELHMKHRGDPRTYTGAGLRSEAELDALGNA